MQMLVERVGLTPLWGETEAWEKQFQRSKSSWILMTRANSGWFHNSYFWLAPETPMKICFHAALKCCACSSYRSSAAFLIQARAPKARSYSQRAVMPSSGVFQSALKEASMQSGSLSEFCRVHVRSNATRKALGEATSPWHACEMFPAIWGCSELFPVQVNVLLFARTSDINWQPLEAQLCFSRRVHINGVQLRRCYNSR